METREVREKAAACRARLSFCPNIEILAEDEWAQNRYDDFNLWAAGIGVFANEWKASLDYRLKSRPDVLRVVLGLLSELGEKTEECIRYSTVAPVQKSKAKPFMNPTDILVGRHFTAEDSDNLRLPKGKQPSRRPREDKDSWVDEDKLKPPNDPNSDGDSLSPWSEPSDDEDEDDTFEHWSPRNALSYSKQGVRIALAQLTRLSFIIRKAGAQFRYQRADKALESALHKHEDLKRWLEFLVLWSPHQESLDPYRQLLFRTFTANAISSSPQPWPTCLVQKFITDPARLTDIQERLIYANLKRRNRFYFARETRKVHVAKPVQPKPQPKLPEPRDPPVLAKPVEVVPAPPSHTGPSHEHKPPSKVAKSVLSATELGSQLVLPPVNAPSVISRVSSTGKKLNYPKPPPVEAGRDSFECPYCCQVLPIKYAKRHGWRRHVMQDLHPYSCISEDCTVPEKLFESSAEWTKHIEEAHSIEEWRCYTCPTGLQSFKTSKEFREHLQNTAAHLGTFSDGQLPVLVDAGRILVCNELNICPLCKLSERHIERDRISPEKFNDEPQRSIQDHIAEHLHAFALLSLPILEDAKGSSSHGSANSVRSSIIWSDPDDSSGSEDNEDEDDDVVRAYKAIKPALNMLRAALQKLASNEDMKHLWATPWSTSTMVKFPYKPGLTYLINSWGRNAPPNFSRSDLPLLEQITETIRESFHSITTLSEEWRQLHLGEQSNSLRAELDKVEMLLWNPIFQLDTEKAILRSRHRWESALTKVHARAKARLALAEWFGSRAIIDKYPKQMSPEVARRWKRVLGVVLSRRRVFKTMLAFRNRSHPNRPSIRRWKLLFNVFHFCYIFNFSIGQEYRQNLRDPASNAQHFADKLDRAIESGLLLVILIEVFTFSTPKLVDSLAIRVRSVNFQFELLRDFLKHDFSGLPQDAKESALIVADGYQNTCQNCIADLTKFSQSRAVLKSLGDHLIQFQDWNYFDGSNLRNRNHSIAQYGEAVTKIGTTVASIKGKSSFIGRPLFEEVSVGPVVSLEANGRCHFCNKIHTFFENLKSSEIRSTSSVFDFHPSVGAIRSSAVLGCSLCNLFLEFFQEGNEGHSFLTEGMNSSLKRLVDLYWLRRHFTVRLSRDMDGEMRLRLIEKNELGEKQIREYGVYCDEGSNLAKTFWTSGRTGSPDRDTDEAIHTYMNWMRTCETEHGMCNSSPNQNLPTLVLELTYGSPSLVIGAERPRARYATFSSCWGTRNSLTLTSANVEEFLNVIPLERIPPAIQEAMRVAKRLGLRYLWVDSLCIMQDVKEDWERESKNMKQYFAESYLNIAAIAISGRDEEFLYPGRSKSHFNKYSFSLRSETGSGLDLVHLRNYEIPTDPGLTRGWMFQELIIPPRTIAFGTKSVVWSCMERTKCDIGYANIHSFWRTVKCFKDMSTINKTSKNFYRTWLTVVEEYSKQRVTYLSDKLLAIGAVAEIHGEKFKHRPEGHETTIQQNYLAGLFRTDFVHFAIQLAWYRAETESEARDPSDIYIAPSWSWASFDGPVQFPDFLLMYSMTALVDVLEATCDRTTDYMHGAVFEGRLVLKAPCVRHTHLKDRLITYEYTPDNIATFLHDQETVLFLALMVSKEEGETSNIVYGLLVAPKVVSDVAATELWKRVGMAKIWMDTDIWGMFDGDGSAFTYWDTLTIV